VKLFLIIIIIIIISTTAKQQWGGRNIIPQAKFHISIFKLIR